MKRFLCLVIISAMLGAALPATRAEDRLKDVRCDEWHFSIRIPAGINTYPVSSADPHTDSAVAGGLKLTAGTENDFPWIRVIRRSRIYDPETYLGISFGAYLEQYGNNKPGECTVYSFGGRTLYGNTGTVYGERGEELFREIRLIPVSDNRGTEFAAQYTAESEAEVISLLDTVIRYYRPDQEKEKAEAAFLPAGHSGKPDLENGEYLFRVEDADKIESDGYFTAILYLPDYYSSDEVHAMRPGDTILIMDRILTITGIDPWEEDDGSLYETDLYTADDTLADEHFCFTLIPTEDGTAYWPYFGEDNHSASRVGTVRIRIPQTDPVEYVYETEDGPVLISDDLLKSFEGDSAMAVIGWNEYSHRCCFSDGRLVRVETWAYPHSPEDVFAQ